MDASSQPSLHERYVDLVAKPTYWAMLGKVCAFGTIPFAVAASHVFIGPAPIDMSRIDVVFLAAACCGAICAVLALPVWAWNYWQWRRDVIAELLATGRQGSPR